MTARAGVDLHDRTGYTAAVLGPGADPGGDGTISASGRSGDLARDTTVRTAAGDTPEVTP